ncbi:MAG: glycoside hydrolase family 97 protein [Bacteroidetes bacterium]|nr:glycoside hydrolase family 97 protein [Bacteroidota bacterium]MCW5894587.1 glycoside hydrolase family 97 protein [Bacteroidota bacterium]
MKTLLSLIVSALLVSLTHAQSIQSPNNKLTLTFSLSAEGEPMYKLNFGKKTVILPSKLGIEIKEQTSFVKSFRIEKMETSLVDESWDPVWGEVKTIRNNYRELKVTLAQMTTKPRTMVLVFRLYDEGLGFRYEFPEQEFLDHFVVTDEKTEFHLTGDHKAFWMPGDFDTNEYAYSETKLSEVDAEIGRRVGEIFTRSVISKDFVQTPVMMKSADGLYINIFEAAVVNYPAMCLHINKENFLLTSAIAPDPVGNKAYLQTPARTPWRVVFVSDKAADILGSKIILNLNEPSKIQDVSWIKPIKYIGIWWELHVGRSSWNYADVNNVRLGETDWKSLKPNGRHGATTERTKYYIDFAAKHGFDQVLVEGWNVGWEDWFGKWKEEVFDFVTPYPDFDVDELQKYAASKGVKLMMHHETSASVTNYERRMDDAFSFMNKHGYDAVKTGYVGKIIPRGEYHDGQWMTNHYVRVVEKAAKYKIMVNAHEPVRPTGLHRTWPNWLACEAARGNEFNAWSQGNPPFHETILPFTRLLGGPMDYTPGIFQIKMNFYNPDKKEQVHTTLTKQLALYVTLYSPLQMAADLPENYEAKLDAFQFIKDVAVDWDDTKILEAEPGDYITMARKAKGKNEWYLGAITDENARTATAPLSFLDPKQSYVATIYADAPDAHWEKNPMAYTINGFLVDARTVLKLKLAPGGGSAVSIRPTTTGDLKGMKKYP